MGKKLALSCPHCSSHRIVRNGHPHGDKLQFFCYSCNRYFSEDAAKGYPPTNIPFPIIAYLLYFYKKVPAFSNMRKYRRFINHWLQYLNVSDQEVSRQTVHHWIKNYDKFLDKVITFPETSDFCKQRLPEALPPISKPIPYKRALKVLERKFGKAYCVGLIKDDSEFFQELVEVVCKHGVFGWEFLDSGFGGGSESYRSLSTG